MDGSINDRLKAALAHKAKPPRSWVYFMACHEGGPVKIGMTQDVQKRRESLQTARELDLHILAYLPGGTALETEWHKRFDHYRFYRSTLRTEWFRGAPDLIQAIIKACQPVGYVRPDDAELSLQRWAARPLTRVDRLLRGDITEEESEGRLYTWHNIRCPV